MVQMESADLGSTEFTSMTVDGGDVVARGSRDGGQSVRMAVSTDGRGPPHLAFTEYLSTAVATDATGWKGMEDGYWVESRTFFRSPGWQWLRRWRLWNSSRPKPSTTHTSVDCISF